MTEYKRIAHNTFFLYFRMIFLIGVLFYTSRVLLDQLGVEDYGVYNLTGGVVAMFASLRTVFATAIQRFLNYEKGLGNKNRLPDIFYLGVRIQFILCVIFFVLAEVVGLWFLNYKLVIPGERLYAAHWVFQYSVLAAMVSIMTVPYDAVIIANERMKIFAYIAILDGVLRLVVAWVLACINFDKLIIYALLILLVSVLIRAISIIYCKRHFVECSVKGRFDKLLFKEMGLIAGWNFLGNFMFSVVNEGLNILLNLFGGIVANAARSISYQLKAGITTLLANVIIAVEPQATHLYAQGDKIRFYNLLFATAKIITFLYIGLGLPLFFFANDVLLIWLDEVPKYTVAFIQAIIVYLFVRTLHDPINVFFLIIGKLKYYQITELILLGLSVPLSYVALKYYDMPLYSVFLIMAVVEAINLIVIIGIARKIGSFEVVGYVKRVILPYVTVLVLSSLAVWSIKNNFYFEKFQSSWNSLFLITASMLTSVGISYVVGLSAVEKRLFRTFINHKK